MSFDQENKSHDHYNRTGALYSEYLKTSLHFNDKKSAM